MACSFAFSSLLSAGIAIAMLGATQASAAEYIVKLRGQTGFNDRVASLRAEQNLKVVDAHVDGGLLKIVLDETQKGSLAQRLVNLLSHPDVAYVVPNIRIEAFTAAPNDPRYTEQWSHNKVGSEAAWNTNVGSRDVVVAVIDTGVDTKHPDLAENIWVNSKEVAGNGVDDDQNGFVDDINGWDFRDSDKDPMDETSDKNPGHGTHCAGIVGAVGNNGEGISGMSQVVSIMAIRFLGADGSGDLYNAAKSIDYAVANGAHIISASWGAAVPESGAQPIVEAIGRASEKGVIFIAAAANDGKNNDTTSVFPANANFPNMISVAASQADDSKPQWSNFGKSTVHLASPGHEILSTLPDSKYGKLSGTSMATPKVSGLAALLVAQYGPGLDGQTLRSILQSSGQKVAIETACECRIDAGAAMKTISDETMVVVPAAATLAPQATMNFGAFGAQGPLSFQSSNQDVATIDNNGTLSAKAVGETQITVTGADNRSAKSLKIFVGEKVEEATCPLGDEMLCMLMCLIQPDLPWCQQ
jgi:thermitase